MGSQQELTEEEALFGQFAGGGKSVFAFLENFSGYQLMETEGEFRERYESGSAFPIDWGSNMLSFPCSCEDEGGPWHWVAIQNDPVMIEDHHAIERIRKQKRNNQ